MNILEKLNLKTPFLRMKQCCESCGKDFSCEIGITGCWCSQIKLEKETLKVLKAKYKKCLCRPCLEAISELKLK